MEIGRTIRRTEGSTLVPMLPARPVRPDHPAAVPSRPLLSIGRLLAGRADEVIRQRRKAARTSDQEAIHHLRVATRRLQEALDIGRPVLDPRPLRRLDRRARRLRQALGRRRNLDVMRDLLRSVARRLPAKARHAARRLARRLESHAVVPSVELPPIRKRARALLRTAERGPTLPIASRGREVLAERARAMERHLGAGRGQNGDRLHRLRIAVKRYRYTLEILDEAGIEGLEPAIRSARKLQRDLGGLHDLDILIDLVRRETAGADRRVLAPALKSLRPLRLGRARASLIRFRALLHPGPTRRRLPRGAAP
jgi:CHAD domain-containing protein